MDRPRSHFPDLVTAAIARNRSLVPVPEEHPDSGVDHLRGLGATFLAHLIATRDNDPQTRVKRRASPDEAIGSYSHATPGENDILPIKVS